MSRCDFDCGETFGRCVRRDGHPGMHVPRAPAEAKEGNVLNMGGVFYALQVANGKAKHDEAVIGYSNGNRRRTDKDRPDDAG